ncbi:hydrogenase maturation nickel metallochaperone HypA [uncultured Thermanaerothrix sp.]|uniref:hydrogenase maturation nickel metallochaperone HypA n=1 Tax=uncultured Thermanaerothrix sp. TaxID=1195149 RepID=UPI002629B620|nr:hydrogenase maturation nickel metallochaperone HypA [uncultured Thermanaerothrix sp.]
MHELPVTENILSIALKHAQAAGARRVTDIHIVLGKFSSIVDDSVQFYWDLISGGTICEGARLHFQRLTPRMRCQDCQHEFEVSGEIQPCPQCNSLNLILLSGDEFYLESIEIER